MAQGVHAVLRRPARLMSPLATKIGCRPRSRMLEWDLTLPSSLGKTRPRSPLGHFSFHSRNALTTSGGHGIDR